MKNVRKRLTALLGTFLVLSVVLNVILGFLAYMSDYRVITTTKVVYVNNESYCIEYLNKSLTEIKRMKEILNQYEIMKDNLTEE